MLTVRTYAIMLVPFTGILKKIIPLSIVIAVLFWTIIVSAGDQIIIKSETKVNFTSNSENDTYEITVKGTKFDDYIVTYRILAYDGTELYSFSAKYKEIGVDPPETKEDIQQDLEKQTENFRFCDERSGSLPCWNELKKQELLTPTPPSLIIIAFVKRIFPCVPIHLDVRKSSI